MSNEKFKVKFGLQVGDTAASIDSTSGDIVTLGDVDVKGGNITNTTGALSITTASNGDITIDPDGTGQVNINAALDVNGNLTGDLLQIDNIQINGNTIISTDTNGNISMTPNGTGSVAISKVDIASGEIDNTVIGANTAVAGTFTTVGATTGNITTVNATTVDTTNIEVSNIKAKDGTAAVTIADSTGAVTVSTQLSVDNINISGNSIISTDTNGNITLAPNGTGDVALTFSNGGNLTNTRNYVYGGIRNATTDSIGDIWALNSTGPSVGTRGISIDNSVDTTKTAGLVLRQGSSTATAPARIVFERSRGTVGTPSALQSNDIIGIINNTGYTSTGWLNDNIAAVSPANLTFSAAENWVSNTNLGTALSVSLAPTATTITSGANLTTVISHNPQAATYRSDAFTFRQGKTGTTDLLTLGTSTSAISSNRINILASGVTAAPYQSSILPSTGSANGEFTLATASSDGSKKSSFNFNSYRYNGTTLSATQTNDVLGEYKFNGNTATSGSTPSVPGAPCGNITVYATENWSGTANGAGFNFSAIKTGTLTSVELIKATATGTVFKADSYTFQDSAGTNVIGNKITYNRVYGQWQYDATVTPAASNTAYAYPIAGASGVTDYANIASVGSTSRIIPGALGMYKLQFSVQLENTDSGSEHTAYFWWRKNGTDVPASMGRVGIPKGTSTIAGWDNMIEVTDTSHYWELMYAVDDAAHVSLPYYGATAFGPETASMFITLVPIGA